MTDFLLQMTSDGVMANPDVQPAFPVGGNKESLSFVKVSKLFFSFILRLLLEVDDTVESWKSAIFSLLSSSSTSYYICLPSLVLQRLVLFFFILHSYHKHCMALSLSSFFLLSVSLFSMFAFL